MEPAPAKTRITPELIEEWTRDAGVLLDANCSDAEVIRDLRERGCTPRMAEMIVAKAKAPVRARHRGYGLVAVLIGGCMFLLALFLDRHPLLILPRRLSMDPWLLMILGGVVAALGAYKVLSGSAVDIETTVRGTADDELNQGKIPRIQTDSTNPHDFCKTR